jgi:GNAT superfamily N-acetyltransferase
VFLLESIKIIQVNQLPNEISQLVEESTDEGFRHSKRLVDEYQNGTNRFDKQGEALFIAYTGNQIIGVSGLNQDPYSDGDGIGRVRRLYVSRAFRRFGVGRLLMVAVVEEARKHYTKLVLFTNNPVADSFYCSIGFTVETDKEHNSHYLGFAGK